MSHDPAELVAASGLEPAPFGTPKRPHPAKYHPGVLHAMAVAVGDEGGRLGRMPILLDPMAGTGRALDLPAWGLAVELEPEWAAHDDRVLVGDATALPEAWTGAVDVVAVSPAYGNRMADSHHAQDKCKACDGSGRNALDAKCRSCGGSGLSRRHTYTHELGRPLSPGSSGGLQWGRAYRQLHELAWANAWRCLAPGGLFLLNVKNHVRTVDKVAVVQRVAEWHITNLLLLGGLIEQVERIDVGRGLAHGANYDVREPVELLAAIRKPGGTDG